MLRAWQVARASVLLGQLGHEGTMRRGNVARDVKFCMQKNLQSERGCLISRSL